MNTSGPSGITRRSASDATDTRRPARATARPRLQASSARHTGARHRRARPAMPPPAAPRPLRARARRSAARRAARTLRPAPRSVSARARRPRCSSSRARSGLLAMLSGVVTIITGPASSVENTRAEGGIRSRRSNRTRVSGRRRCTSRTVSSGSSTSTVSEPTRDRVDLGAHRMRVPQRVAPSVICGPLARSCRHPIVEARRRLHDDERPAPAS